MAREDLARDSDRLLHDHWSSPQLAGATAGTVLRSGPTAAAASTGSALHGTVSVPAGVPASARVTADVRSSTDSVRIGFADESEYSFDGSAVAGGRHGS
ncbi:hypothetical protein BRD15_07940 [Halobacteriales archaeon SW_6_65_15]|nr:MAG: hypothetical protein BRD15_07940 [Halobacteriales archaeon SW_6_65_15]